MAVIGAVHKLPFTAFVAGSDKGGHTRAKAGVWSQSADFKAAEDKMFEAMAKLDVAVKTGSLDKVKDAFGPTGGACKGCHDDFRSK
jgi:cytochrome c556